jgi:capsid protein
VGDRRGGRPRVPHAPGFFDDPIIRAAYCSAEWTGPAMGQLNPLDEIDAAEKRIRVGVSTRQIETAALMGQNWEEVTSSSRRSAGGA